jgi:hypothetical protein
MHFAKSRYSTNLLNTSLSSSSVDLIIGVALASRLKADESGAASEEVTADRRQQSRMKLLDVEHILRL